MSAKAAPRKPAPTREQKREAAQAKVDAALVVLNEAKTTLESVQQELKDDPTKVSSLVGSLTNAAIAEGVAKANYDSALAELNALPPPVEGSKPASSKQTQDKMALAKKYAGSQLFSPGDPNSGKDDNDQPFQTIQEKIMKQFSVSPSVAFPNKITDYVVIPEEGLTPGIEYPFWVDGKIEKAILLKDQVKACRFQVSKVYERWCITGVFVASKDRDEIDKILRLNQPGRPSKEFNRSEVTDELKKPLTDASVYKPQDDFFGLYGDYIFSEIPKREKPQPPEKKARTDSQLSQTQPDPMAWLALQMEKLNAGEKRKQSDSAESKKPTKSTFSTHPEALLFGRLFFQYLSQQDQYEVSNSTLEFTLEDLYYAYRKLHFIFMQNFNLVMFFISEGLRGGSQIVKLVKNSRKGFLPKFVYGKRSFEKNMASVYLMERQQIKMPFVYDQKLTVNVPGGQIEINVARFALKRYISFWMFFEMCEKVLSTKFSSLEQASVYYEKTFRSDDPVMVIGLEKFVIPGVKRYQDIFRSNVSETTMYFENGYLFKMDWAGWFTNYARGNENDPYVLSDSI